MPRITTACWRHLSEAKCWFDKFRAFHEEDKTEGAFEMNESPYSLGKAKQYQKKRQKLSLIHLFLTPAILCGLILTPLSGWFRDYALSVTTSGCLVVTLYFALFSLYMLIFDIPSAFYSGFILERRFGLSNHTPLSWGLDFLKKSVLSFLVSWLLIEVLYFLIRQFPHQWWIFAWAGFSFASCVLGKIFPVFIVPLFYKYGKVENDLVREKIFKLAARFSLPLENVYSLNLSRTTKKANAAFMGLGKTKRVVLSDTLLSHFTAEEIETVVAHEIGHFKHRDIWKQLALGMLTSLLAFRLAYKSLDPAARFFGFEGAQDVASLPLLFLIFYGVYLILTPLQNGISRIFERAADRFALEVCKQPGTFISCMTKLGEVNLSDPEPHPLWEWFFYDHPAIGKRIKMAEQWKE